MSDELRKVKGGEDCSKCDGTGKVWSSQSYTRKPKTMRCPDCNGTGQQTLSEWNSKDKE